MIRLETIIADYKLRHQERGEKELHWFAIQKTLEEAVRLAALAETPGHKRFSHQRRIPRSALEESRRCLLRCLPALAKARNFEELFELVSACLNPIPGIGELTIYDTAQRIGAKLHLAPEMVYLHAGTRIGAKRLGFDGNRPSIKLSELPAPLSKLEAREVEDILCIYKENFDPKSLQISSRRGCGA
jgi:hypothetical protein